MKINLYKWLLFLIAFFIPVNLLKDLFSIPLTLVMGGGILLLLLLINIFSRSRYNIIIISVSILLFLLTLIFSNDIETNIRYFINWFSLINVLLLLANNDKIQGIKNCIIENEKKLHYVSIFNFILLVVLYFIPASHSLHWGISDSFKAFTVSHAVASSIATLLCFESVYFIRNRNFISYILMFFVLSFLAFETGARIYIISIISLAILVFNIVIKKRNTKLVFVILSVLLALIIIPNSSFGEKMNITSNYQVVHNTSFLNAITSGRIEFWKIDVIKYFQSSPRIWFFGNGFDYSYYINATFYHLEIFSHNLFLETLLSLGLMGFLLLLSVIKRNYAILEYKFIIFIYSIYFVLVAFLNGMIDSQIYCFSLIVFNILCLIINDINKKEVNYD